jgi:hypothetical protein
VKRIYKKPLVHKSRGELFETELEVGKRFPERRIIIEMRMLQV